MKKNLFRKNAMDKMLSPMELDRSLVIVSRKSWLALLSMGLLVLFVIYWSIFGRIYERITASGIILTREGIYTAYAPADGIVVSLNVAVGEYVRHGDLIATILLPEARSEIQSLSSKIEIKSDMLDQVIAFNASMDQSNLAQKTQIQETLDTTIELLKKQIEWHDGFLERLQDSLKSGATSEKSYADFRADNDKLTMNLMDKLTELKKAETDYLKQIKESSREELKLNIELFELSEELFEKINLYRTNSQIISQGTGFVTSILAEHGMVVKANQPIVNINDTSDSHSDMWVLYAYYSLLNSSKIKPGMQVLVTPSMVKAERDGSINGVVHSVNNYVQPVEALNLKYRNKNFSDTIFKMSNNMPVEVKIILNSNPDSFSGFDWTSGLGPNIQIPEGTYCTTSIAVQTLRPIELVFAKARKLFFGTGVNEEGFEQKIKNTLK